MIGQIFTMSHYQIIDWKQLGEQGLAIEAAISSLVEIEKLVEPTLPVKFDWEKGAFLTALGDVTPEAVSLATEALKRVEIGLYPGWRTKVSATESRTVQRGEFEAAVEDYLNIMPVPIPMPVGEKPGFREYKELMGTRDRVQRSQVAISKLEEGLQIVAQMRGLLQSLAPQLAQLPDNTIESLAGWMDTSPGVEAPEGGDRTQFINWQ
jgi:hypothetical protein